MLLLYGQHTVQTAGLKVSLSGLGWSATTSLTRVAVFTYYVTQSSARWRKAFDFVDEADEAIIRGVFVQLIDHLSQLSREERCA